MLISVVTAAGPGAERWLRCARDGLAEQSADFEWLVVEDGAFLQRVRLPDNARVFRTSPRARGAAAARTVALTQARGELVYVHDSDDVLPAEALTALSEGIGDAAWAASRRWRVIDEHGEVLETRASVLAPGRLDPGHIRDFWRRKGRCPFPPAQVLYRTDAIWEAGGWPPLPADEDVALLLRVSDRHPGVIVEGTNLHSRRHPEQVSATTPSEVWELGRTFCERSRIKE